MSEWLEHFWGEILSREADRTRTAFEALEDADERQAILQHLQRMASEEGWTEPQRLSARLALSALSDWLDGDH